MKNVFIKLIMLLCFLFIPFQIAEAKTNINANISSNFREVKVGEEVIVTLRMKDFVEVEKGINAYKTTLEYDENIFEEVKESDFSSLNKWEFFKYNSKTKEIVAVHRTGVKEDSNVVSIRLKVKKNAIASNTTVSFRDIVASEGKEDIFLPDQKITMSIIKKQEVIPNKPNGNGTSNITVSGSNESETTEPTDSDTIDKNPQNDNENNNDKTENNYGNIKEEVEENVPKTRCYYWWLILIVLIEVILLIWYYKKKGKKNPNNLKKFLFIIATGLISFQLIGCGIATAVVFSLLGEVNGDRVVNYDDVEVIEKHIIHLQNINSDFLENADINADQKITVTDLTLLVQKLENTLVYAVDISDAEQTLSYAEKNSEITLKFNASVSYGATIESVYVNGVVYPVYKTNGTDEYAFKINTLNNAGRNDFLIQNVTLSNGKVIKVQHPISLEILKDMPQFSNYVVEDDINNAKQTISFDIIDKDSSVTSAILYVYDEDEVKQEFEAISGHNTFEIDVEEGKFYPVQIVINYNRSSVSEGDENVGTLVYDKELQLNVDYQFSFSNLKAYKGITESSDFEKLEEIRIGFSSNNATIHEPISIKINGHIYDTIIKENGEYFLTIRGFENFGSNDILVEEVTLANGKSFVNFENNLISVNVIKRKPVISDFTYEEDTTDNTIRFEFGLNDEDQSLKSVTLQLLDENGKEISMVNLAKEELTQNSISKILHTELADKYVVRVTASYIQKDELIDEVLYEEIIEAQPRINIELLPLSKIYYEKNEIASFDYKITTNKKEEIQYIRVNNVDYFANHLESDIYSIVINVPETSGVLELSTTKIIFESNLEVEANIETAIEVLKDKPNIQNIVHSDDVPNSEIILEFDLFDTDDSFLSGKAIVTKEEDNTVREFTFDKDHSKINIPVENAKFYKLELKVSYDRDTNQLTNDANTYEEIMGTYELYLLSDYELTVEDIKTFNNDIETNTFKKNENILLSFKSTNISPFKPEKVVINGETYTLIVKEDNIYQVELPGYYEAKVEELHIESIILDNAHKEEVADKNISVSILKDKPTIENFGYERSNQNTLLIKFNVIDNEDAFKNGIVQLITGEKVILEDAIHIGENRFEVEIEGTEITTYTIKVIADYNLDPAENEDNLVQNEEIFNQDFELSPYVIELKEVVSNKLYYKNQEITSLDITKGIPTDLENYYVKVMMQNLPTYYANVEKFVLDSQSKQMSVVIKQNDFIKYQDNGNSLDREQKYSFKIDYEDQDGKHQVNYIKSADELFASIISNPTGTFVLEENLDASSISASTSAMNITFKGTLDGNGHKIINLPTVLFTSLDRATIKNLVIENAKITNNSKAFIANTITNQTIIMNTHIIDSSLNNGQNSVGSFAGTITNSTIKESSVVNVYIRASNTIGGIVGQMSSGSIVENCYVTGTLAGTINHNLGARVGGITGWDSGNKIENVYTNVTLQAPSQTGNGGLIGGPDGGNPTITNAISIGSGTGYRLSGFGRITNMHNVYEYSKSASPSHIRDGITNIGEIENIYDKSFYKDTLGFDESIWNLDLVENNILPILRNGPLAQDLTSYETLTNKNNIPNYSEIRTNSKYKAENEILYYNLSKLKPFADTRNWLEMANAFNGNSLLSTQKIKFIIPSDENGNTILGLMPNTATAINKIRIVFENQATEVYEVEHLMNIEDLVATYKIKDLNLEYEFDNYIKAIDESLLDRIVNIASSYDYATQIASLTSEEESRLYVDFYNESVKDNIRQMLINFMLNSEDTPTYSDNYYVKQIIEGKFTEDYLKQLLYAYNYIEKWYHFDLDGTKLSDLLFFNGKKLNGTMTIDYFVNSVVNTSEGNRSTSNTHGFFNAYIKDKVGMDLANFLPYLFKTLNGYDDPSDWMQDHFKGIIYEQPATGTYSDQVIYRIWPIMIKSHIHVVLPILSAPNEDMYMISCPTQFIIGSMNRYSTYLNKDGNERTRMYNAIQSYAQSLGIFYGTSAGFIPNSVDILNARGINAQFDTRFYFPASDKADAGTQSAGTTRDPVMKWVYEAIGGAWAAANGSGAYANGYNVWWVVDTALGGDRAVHVFTHETAHNQDGGYFYARNGRRSQTGAESHADGVIAQDLGINTQIFNITKNFSLDSDYATNLTFDRINTAEKMDSYYKEMFEAKYVLEYLAGQAFLKLTPEEQAKVAIQMQHGTSGSNYSTQYVRLTADDFRKMNLKTMEDLWDNHIAIRGTGSSADTWTGRYGYDSFFNFHFYIVNNPNGAPDVNTFKNTGFEMLGYAGYDKGFITYMSGRSKNDLDAIQKITGDNTMTWKKYKMSRYENVEENLNKIKYYDIEELTALYERALKTDAANGNLNTSVAVTRLYYGILKRATNDFTTGGIYTNPEPASITSAQQLIDAINNDNYGNYRIDADLDFSNINPVEGTSYYIAKRFLGTIDGNGYKLKGMRYTLFNNIVYAHIKNISIESPEYSENIKATLALTGKNFIVYNCDVIDSNINITNIASKSGLYFSLGKNDLSMRSYTIDSVDNFLAIASSNISLKSKYVLTKDIDFTGYTPNSTSVIMGEFTGVIDGNGHTIKNLTNASLFANFKGTVSNLSVRDFTNIQTGDEVAAFAANASNAIFRNMSFENIRLEGRHRVAPVVANDNAGSVYEQISVKNANVKATGYYASAFVGRKYDGSIKNVYADGNLEIYTTTNGGIVGALERNATVTNVVSNVNINRPKSTDDRNQNGGFVGYLGQNTNRISNSISLGNMTGFIQNENQINSGKFVGPNNEAPFIPLTFSNCFEFEGATGIAGIGGEGIKVANDTDIHKKEFYKNTLHFDESIWNLDTISSNGYPTLK